MFNPLRGLWRKFADFTQINPLGLAFSLHSHDSLEGILTIFAFRAVKSLNKTSSLKEKPRSPRKKARLSLGHLSPIVFSGPLGSPGLSLVYIYWRAKGPVGKDYTFIPTPIFY